MAKFKSAGHHWWPETLSSRWKDDEGCVHWLKPSGEVVRSPPKNFGLIGNGHAIKLSPEPGGTSPWDENFEAAFQAADDGWSALIDWLEALEFQPGAGRGRRFLPQPASDEQTAKLVEGLVSLAVRSPTTRDAAAGLADRFGPPMDSRGRNNVIGLNLRHAQTNLTRQIGVRGKYVVIHSPDREFIFGDGFGHNLTNQHQLPLNPHILAPLTPRLAVLWTRPMSYAPEPRLTTMVVTSEEAKALNEVVQIYAKRMVFYRHDKPDLIDAFRAETHFVFRDSDNTMQALIEMVPGVTPANPDVRTLRRMMEGRDRLGGES